jgi:hypothetical protein
LTRLKSSGVFHKAVELDENELKTTMAEQRDYIFSAHCKRALASILRRGVAGKPVLSRVYFGAEKEMTLHPEVGVGPCVTAPTLKHDFVRYYAPCVYAILAFPVFCSCVIRTRSLFPRYDVLWNREVVIS